ncbi:quinon protein alcohol dehydrogenase-like superfamily [Chytriomyces cf. hyalinus JEL632]|nr:quinon protein alcohol dehydrogenase-like superfamily [Chytriomyces cf. hyalinus JEL632]
MEDKPTRRRAVRSRSRPATMRAKTRPEATESNGRGRPDLRAARSSGPGNSRTRSRQPKEEGIAPLKLALSAVIIILITALVFVFGSHLQTSFGAKQRTRSQASTSKHLSHPWPSFRSTCENTGFAPFKTHLKPATDPTANHNANYWAFQTGRGIFSVPAISAFGQILIGSADRKFYALDELTGKVLWKITTGEIIDSAAAIHGENIIFASGDGHVYNASIHDGTIHWKFAAHHQEGTADEHEGLTCGEESFITAHGGTSTWFEGQVQISPIDGRVYIGNDDYRLYSIHANGSEAYNFYPGPLPYGTIWSGPAITRSGSVIGSSMNGKYFKLDKNGKCIWFHEEMYSISSGPAVEADLKMVFLGSWNGVMRAVNHTNGHTVWTFSAGDQIYGGVAVDAARRCIYFGSQDGVFYAVNSLTGKSVWRYRVNYPIRTSPALALDAVYFGAANGMIYALKPDTGDLIWSFDTTEDPDHREINASPALGHTSVVFGSEDGRIISIPYRYCLEAKTRKDPRCHTQTSEIDAVGMSDGRNLYYLYPGGIIANDVPDGFTTSGVWHIRLLIVSDNKPRVAHVLQATAELSPPTNGLTIEYLSTSGSVLITPRGFLASDTQYNLTVTMFDNSMTSTKRLFTFRTAANKLVPMFSGMINTTRLTSATTLHIYNLKPSYPPSWISLNQIGFDSVNLLAAIIHVISSNDTSTDYLVWIAAGLLEQDASIILDPTTPTLAPGILSIHPDGTTFELWSQFSVITGGPPIPMTGFSVASHFDVESGMFGTPTAPSWMSWSSWCGDSISSLIGAIQTNMCSTRGRIVTVGAARGRVYASSVSEKPRGWKVSKAAVRSAGWLGTEYVIEVTVSGGVGARAPVFGVVLFDEVRRVPVYLDYKAVMRVEVDVDVGQAQIAVSLANAMWKVGGGEGDLVRVIVMCDMYPLFNEVLKVDA